MDELIMAQAYILNEIRRIGVCAVDNKVILEACSIAARMKAEADKRKKEEAEKKRKEIRELLNANNTFIEREGQHFDDVHWQPDWSQAPKHMNYFFMNRNGSKFWAVNEPDKPNSTEHVMNFTDCGGDCYAYASDQDYKGDWRTSLRKRPVINQD